MSGLQVINDSDVIINAPVVNTNHALQIFNNPEFGEIRIIEIDNNPWFVLRDVCNGLGIERTDDVVRRLDDDEAGLTRVEDSAGRKQDTYIINEGGLYSVILRSNKPQAKTFKRWITHDVIPTIRKTGSYNIPQLTPSEVILQIAQNQVALEKRINTNEQEIQNIKQTTDKLQTALTVFANPRADTWRDEMDNAINHMVETYKRSPSGFRGQLYKELETTANKSLSRRVACLKTRLKKQGATYKECEAVTKLDAISKNKDLRLIFEGIVKKYQALYAAK